LPPAKSYIFYIYTNFHFIEQDILPEPRCLSVSTSNTIGKVMARPLNKYFG